MNKIPLVSMFLQNSGGLSSKRIVGVVSYAICLGLLIYATIYDKQLPDFADFIIITSSSLLGIDAFKGMFQKQE